MLLAPRRGRVCLFPTPSSDRNTAASQPHPLPQLSMRSPGRLPNCSSSNGQCLPCFQNLWVPLPAQLPSSYCTHYPWHKNVLLVVSRFLQNRFKTLKYSLRKQYSVSQKTCNINIADIIQTGGRIGTQLQPVILHGGCRRGSAARPSTGPLSRKEAAEFPVFASCPVTQPGRVTALESDLFQETAFP